MASAPLSQKQLLDRESVMAWVFLAPALLLMGIFILGPIVYLFYLSFTQGSFTRSGVYWVGFKNYLRLFLSPDFWQVIWNTTYFTVATVIPTLIIPLGLAVLLNRTFALQDLLRTKK